MVGAGSAEGNSVGDGLTTSLYLYENQRTDPMETILFTQLDLTVLDKRFDLEQVFDSKALAEWLS